MECYLRHLLLNLFLPFLPPTIQPHLPSRGHNLRISPLGAQGWRMGFRRTPS